MDVGKDGEIKIIRLSSGVKSVHNLAGLLGINSRNVFNWIKNESMTPEMAENIVALSNGKLCKLEDFFPWIFHNTYEKPEAVLSDRVRRIF